MDFAIADGAAGSPRWLAPLVTRADSSPPRMAAAKDAMEGALHEQLELPPLLLLELLQLLPLLPLELLELLELLLLPPLDQLPLLLA